MNWERENKYTFVLDLPKKVEESWYKIESRGRNMVRKAIKCEVKILKENNLNEVLDEFFEMLGESDA